MHYQFVYNWGKVIDVTQWWIFCYDLKQNIAENRVLWIYARYLETEIRIFLMEKFQWNLLQKSISYSDKALPTWREFNKSILFETNERKKNLSQQQQQAATKLSQTIVRRRRITKNNKNKNKKP